jgi:hypothetical protein
MALFVAKLLENTFADTSPLAGPAPVPDDPDRESPALVSAVRKSHRVSREMLGKKLTRMYMKNSQRQIHSNIEEAKQVMTQWDPASRVSASKAGMKKTDLGTGELLRVAEPEEDFDSSRMSVEDYVAASLQKLESVRAEIRAEAEARKAEDGRLRLEMEQQVEVFFGNGKLEKICDNLKEIATNVRTNVFEHHHEDIRKGEFLDGVVCCLKLTNQARKEMHANPMHVSNCLEETQNILNHFESLGLMKSSCYRVLMARFRTVMNEFATSLVDRLEVPESRREAYRILRKFKNKKFSVERKLLSPWLKKFEYHFVRPGSALNEPDKPEWPLKWFIETGKEIKRELNEDSGDVLIELAKHAREYFDQHRWSVIKDPSEDAFSLYLSKYLDFARQVEDLLGKKALVECMRGFAVDADVTTNGWQLLHEWIMHDRRYFENVLDGIKDPWIPSKIDPNVNELTQTLLDMLSACTNRIEPLTVFPESRREFVVEACDHVVRSYIVQGVRIEMANDIPLKNRPLMVKSLSRMITVGVDMDLVSPQARKLLSELINELE